MKKVLIHVLKSTNGNRLTEAVRVAAGLSQQPGLQISLVISSSPPSLLSQELLGHFTLFSEKGRLYVDSEWEQAFSIASEDIHCLGCEPSLEDQTDSYIPF